MFMCVQLQRDSVTPSLPPSRQEDLVQAGVGLPSRLKPMQMRVGQHASGTGGKCTYLYFFLRVHSCVIHVCFFAFIVIIILFIILFCAEGAEKGYW